MQMGNTVVGWAPTALTLSPTPCTATRDLPSWTLTGYDFIALAAFVTVMRQLSPVELPSCISFVSIIAIFLQSSKSTTPSPAPLVGSPSYLPQHNKHRLVGLPPHVHLEREGSTDMRAFSSI